MADAESIFHEARALPRAEREAFVRGACRGDEALRAEVSSLLEAEASDFLRTAPGAAVTTLHEASGEREGQVIDRYKLLQRIGEGGFGTVWMAEQREPVVRRVALKIIKLGMDTRQVIARFEAERQALAMMDHPNIARVLDAGATETGRPYFVMEYIRGMPILEFCDNEKLDTDRRLDLFTSVCHAIQHAHQKGIIHRDIKPSNVLITLHDGVPVPKVIDFGIAKATDHRLTERTLFTEHRQMIGTPAYMSPEQAEMSGLDIDTRSDIYSLGVLLYELLTGTTPFATEELMSKGFAEMMRIIREVEPHKPSTRLSSLGETGTRTAQQRHTDMRRLGLLLRGDLDWIVMKCLEKDRQRRYETANALAADIRRHLDDEPVSAGPPSAGYRLSKFVRRNRGQVIAGAVIAVALVAGLGGTSAGLAWAIQEKQRADAEAARATAQALLATRAADAEADARRAAEENEGRALSEAERAERALARATEIKRLITEMLMSVSPEEARAENTTLLRRVLDDASSRLADGEISDELVAAELHAVIGDVYYRLGTLDEALPHLEAVVTIDREVLGVEHESTLVAMNRLGLARQDQGRHADAAQVFEAILPVMRRVLGEDHPNTLRAATNLGTTYNLLRRLDAAEALLRDTLERKERVLGEEDVDTLKCMNNLASLYREQQRYAQAELLFRRLLDIRRRLLKPDHPDLLKTELSLALVLSDQGKLAEATRLARSSLEGTGRVYGEDHQQTAKCLHILGGIYQARGDLRQAAASLERARDIRLRTLGPDHPDLLGAAADLAGVYYAAGRYEDAVATLEVCAPAMRRVLGPGHPWTVFAIRGLAAAYVQLGRDDEALPLQRELHALAAAAAERPDATAAELNNAAWGLLAQAREELRDPARALPLAERACRLEEANGGTDLWVYLDTLALAQHLTGDAGAAAQTQRRAIQLMPPASGDRTAFEHRLAHYEAQAATGTEPSSGR